MKKLRLIEVPINSLNHFINKVGCLRYEIGNTSSCIEPIVSGIYLEKEKHQIEGYVEINDKKYIVIKNL